jgi:hypothetical protein
MPPVPSEDRHPRRAYSLGPVDGLPPAVTGGPGGEPHEVSPALGREGLLWPVASSAQAEKARPVKGSVRHHQATYPDQACAMDVRVDASATAGWADAGRPSGRWHPAAVEGQVPFGSPVAYILGAAPAVAACPATLIAPGPIRGVTSRTPSAQPLLAPSALPRVGRGPQYKLSPASP